MTVYYTIYYTIYQEQKTASQKCRRLYGRSYPYRVPPTYGRIKKMDDREKGLTQALTALRKEKRELKQKIEQLVAVAEISDMSSFYKLLDLSEDYFGGIYARLGLGSSLLTAISWHDYPAKSFDNFCDRIKAICPGLGELIGEHGIDYAILFPEEKNPGEDPAWQVRNGFEGYYLDEEVDTSVLQIYSLELFYNLPDPDNVYEWYHSHKQEIEAAEDIFETEVIAEALEILKQKYGMSFEEFSETLENYKARFCDE